MSHGTITPDENGVSDCLCNLDHWILVHDGSEVISMGKWRQSTTKQTIEYFDTEAEMEEHIDELNLVRLPVEEEE